MKKAILMISFGTSHKEQLEKAILGVVRYVEERHTDMDVFWAFSSGVIIKKLQNEEGIKILAVEEVLQKLRDEQYTDVYVQPLHLIPGKEYDKVVALCEPYKEAYTISIGKPLLYEEEDYRAIIHGLASTYGGEDHFLLLVGHGTTHEANKVYEAMDKWLKSEGIVGDIVTLENIDTEPTWLVEKLMASGKKKMIIIPLMLVAGMHVIRELLTYTDTSFTPILKEKALNIEVIQSGLGESGLVKAIFNKHVDKIMGKL